MAHVGTVAFLGLEARSVDVQVQISAGPVTFVTVGLPDKAVKESRERVAAALHAIGLSLPPRRVVVSLSPADLPKEGSHYDLPIALGIIGATFSDTFTSALASDSAGLGQMIYYGRAGGLALDSDFSALAFRVALVTAQQFYWKVDTTDATRRIKITGYEL